MPVIEVRDLVTHYLTAQGSVDAVSGLNFTVEKGQTFGLAGESGCGKTTAALSIMGLLPSNGRIMGGQIIIDGEDLLQKTEAELKKIRWSKVSIVFQGAMNALNPVLNVGEQILEVILEKEDVTKSEALDRVRELFRLVEIEPSRIIDYPHEFSGGMRQRVMIAMALANYPKLVIADEPITALDVIVQNQILELMKDLQRKLDLSQILITHDLSVIAETCDKVGIMYAGKLVEYGEAGPIFKTPLHPYTSALIGAYPSIVGEKKKLNFIPGSPPNLIDPPRGCRFHPRCPYTKEICSQEEPEYREEEPGHYAACHYVEELRDTLRLGD
ncbi:MAG: ABC transporter ATP-binding protein [Candidatus Bathyarchaeota archaeon]|nr:ABC transporter ATP-binding protein [Candidatus Bathyarchaeota archaeon]